MARLHILGVEWQILKVKLPVDN